MEHEKRKSNRQKHFRDGQRETEIERCGLSVSKGRERQKELRRGDCFPLIVCLFAVAEVDTKLIPPALLPLPFFP